MSEIPPAVFSACIAAWCEAIKATALLAQHWPVTPPTAVPSSSQLPSTPVAAVRETASATQVAYPERQEVVEVERPMRIAVTFYLYEVPGEIKLIPGASTWIKLPPTFIIGNLNQFVRHELFPGLPRNVDFEPLTTDKFYFAVTMTRIAGRKLEAVWIGGLNDEFLGTVEDFLDRFCGQVPRIHVVVYRDQRAVTTSPHSRVGKVPAVAAAGSLPKKSPAVVSAPSAVETKPDVEEGSQRAPKRPRSQSNAPRRGQRKRRG